MILGQDVDVVNGNDTINQPEQMFEGQLTSLFIYDRVLTRQQVISAFQHQPSIDNIIVGWWQFKNTTNGTDIVTTPFPFN